MISPTQREQVQRYFEELQNRICTKLEQVDGKERFSEDRWQHHEGGGGRSRVIQDGAVFEKGGVNTSAISSMLNQTLAEKMNVQPQSMFATGISLVLHPLNPFVPTVHANFRYLELENDDWWFGGGADLTPYYLYEEDAGHFHGVWKAVCDRFDPSYYPTFKRWCDDYFFLKHRSEARGIGGIFFDYQRREFDRLFAFVQACGNEFLHAYVPIVERRQQERWTDWQRQWQLIRRGRYVEFNLVYDRGTVFGLETGGRVESILMSLPPLARWDYNVNPEPNSREATLVEVLKHPKAWV